MLLDRQDLKAYVARREQSLILFALAEPEGGDPHTLYVDDLLMSPGTENYKAPPPAELVEEVRRFLNAQLEAGGRMMDPLGGRREPVRCYAAAEDWLLTGTGRFSSMAYSIAEVEANGRDSE